MSTTLNLAAGTQTLRLQFGGSGRGLMNINRFSLESDGDPIDDNDDDNEDDNSIPSSTLLDRSGWSVSASQADSDSLFAIDGRSDTRWTTRTPMRAGQNYTIDMRSSQTINRIVLETSRSDDYPRSYNVELSDDGSRWTQVATGNGQFATATQISFSAQSTRFIRITQLGSANRSWWSIHELNVFGGEATGNPGENPEDNPIDEPIDNPTEEPTENPTENPTEEPTDTPTENPTERPTILTGDWNVSSLSGLQDVIERDNQDIVMRPGNYNMTDLPGNSRKLVFSGSNNSIELTGVYINVPVGSTEKESYIVVEGDNNSWLGGEFEDTYDNGLKEVTDFVSYNQNRDTLAYGLRGNAVMEISGENNTIDGLKLTVRGSWPYGYGSIYGIGRLNVFGLDKRCGIVIKSSGTTIQNVELQQRAFCHGIYMQESADRTTIRNTLVEGRARETNDMLQEGRGSLPYDSDYQIPQLDSTNESDWDLPLTGGPLPGNEANSLSEDGIRTYGGTGSVVVDNVVVKNMRGGIRLYVGTDISVTNSTSIGSGLANFTLGANDSITGSMIDFTNGPVSDFRLSRDRREVDITILPSPNAVGAHNIIDISGNNHDIVLRRANGPEDTRETRVISATGNDSTIRNETEYDVVLESGSRGNTVTSAGDVRDNGSNTVRRIELDL